MRFMSLLTALIVIVLAGPVFAADDILDAIDQARKAYQSGNSAEAKQRLDLASQLIGQKNADSWSQFLPEPLPGWQAKKAQTQSGGVIALTGSTASRSYTNAKGDTVEVQIVGDSAMVSGFAVMFKNPQLAGMAGKLIHIGNLLAIQTEDDGDLNFIVANKYLITVTGSASQESKLTYAQAVNIERLEKL